MSNMSDYAAIEIVKRATEYGGEIVVVGREMPVNLFSTLHKNNCKFTHYKKQELSTHLHKDLRPLLLTASTVINLESDTVACSTDEVFNLISNVHITNFYPYELHNGSHWHDFSKTRLANQFEINEIIEEIKELWPELYYNHRDRIGIISAGADSTNSISQQTIRPLIDTVRLLAKQGCDRFLFCNLQETVQTCSLLKVQLLADALRYEFKPEQFIYATAAMYAAEQWSAQCHKYTASRPISMISANIYDRPWREQEYTVPEFDVNKIPSKLFLSYNNTVRWHRTQLCVMLEKENLLNKGYMSLRTEGPHNFDLGLPPEYDQSIETLKEKQTILLDDVEQRDTHIAFPDHRDIFYHQDSHFSLVTETIFQNNPDPIKQGGTEYLRDLVFYTEKTYKPFWFYQPFIVCAVPGFLKAMRELGWVTFHPWIDESYDQEHDDEKRLQMIVQEVKRLSNFTTEQWQEWRRGVQEAVMVNADRIRRPSHGLLASSDYLHLFT